MNNILVYDTETTGLDTDNDEIFELAWAVLDGKTLTPIHMQSAFVSTSKPLPEEIIELTKMKQEWLDKHSHPAKDVIGKFCRDIASYEVEYIAGHNIIEYDNKILRANAIRAGISGVSEAFAKKNFIDTMTDLPYVYPTKKLSYLAAELGFVNPFPHRALFDVLTTAKIMQYFNIEEILKLAKSPTIEVRALVSYDNRALASKRKYQWNAEKKIWTKKIKECHLQQEQSHNDFEVRKI